MVAAISVTNSSKTPSRPRPKTTRPPLLPSEKDNGVAPPKPNNSKQISSRYMSLSHSSSSSSSSSKRFPSPVASRTPPPAAATPPAKRSQSVERTPRPTTPLPDSKRSDAAAAAAASRVLWTSCRSLSVSFQGESFSLPISRIKPAPSPAPAISSNVRRITPERRRSAAPLRGKGGGDQSENSKLVEQHRWPGRTRPSDPMMGSLDFSSEDLKSGGLAIRSLQQSILVEEDRRRVLFHGRTDWDLDNGSAKMSINGDSDNGSAPACNLTTSTTTASDTESVSSGSNSGTQEFIGTDPPGHTASRGIGIPARFWQETNSRLRRLQEPCLPLSTTTTTTTTNHNLIPVKKSTLFDSPSSSPPMMNQALSSPLRRPVRHPSPSKLFTSTTTMSSSSVSSSPLRGTQSPLRMRNVSASSVSNHSSNPPSILSFAADVRRGKMGENRIEDAHVLRLLYNRHLQWRFVNARAEVGLSIQGLSAEKNLYNAWEATSELRDSVTFKKIQLQLFRQNWKLTTILKGQLFYLDEWALLDRDHSSSLSGAIEAMKASTLRLPVIGGARADVQKVKDAVSSAVDVMQALGSSICSLLSKVQGTDSLVTELANVAAQEQELLSQCKDLLSTVASLQAEECSLRTHLLQLKQVSTLTTVDLNV
ncbi:hypothetical protein MRB53_012593 [Persea americana]|uniref:Uncharacterized protein n=1 Tax=Persea americana TaxID=3435 RepID=A0ACC2LY73_PERAE|nr:hypothetical protein MRB53_012593 [Persea americana]